MVLTRHDNQKQRALTVYFFFFFFFGFILSLHSADLIISFSAPSLPCFAMRGRAPFPRGQHGLSFSLGLAVAPCAFPPSSARPAAYFPHYLAR